MAKSELRAKFGYLTYDDMLAKLSAGQLDAYDIVYCKDRFNQYIITPELTPLEIRSRVYVYASVSGAERALNASTSTYVGQIVSILDGAVYRGYIVNINSDGRYYVTPLYEHSEDIDYNNLGNKPIVNLFGEFATPIVLADLEDGIYEIKGYYLAPNDEGANLTYVGEIVVVATEGAIKSIKKISSSSVFDYTISGSSVRIDKYATEQYIKEQNFVTHDELDSYDFASNTVVDTKIQAMRVALEADLKQYIDTTFMATIQQVVNVTVDTKFEQSEIPDEDIDKLFGVSDSDIDNLFE